VAVSNFELCRSGRVSEVDSRGSTGLVVAVVLGWLLWCKCEVISRFVSRELLHKFTRVSVRVLLFVSLLWALSVFGLHFLRIWQGVSSSPEVGRTTCWCVFEKYCDV
jgi:hypothetical protein